MKVVPFDGDAVPDPSNRSIGVVLLEDNHVLKEISRKLDVCKLSEQEFADICGYR